jgi:hypothetical protein
MYAFIIFKDSWYSGNGIQACGEGYTGILCSKCLGFNANKTIYYSSTGLGSCAACGPLSQQVVILIVLISTILSYVAFIVL